MPIEIVPRYGPEDEFYPEEVSKERLLHFQELVSRHVLSRTHLVRIGQPSKFGRGSGEQLGIYVTPESTGKEMFLNDVNSSLFQEAMFSDQQFLQVLKQVIDTYLSGAFLWIDADLD